MTSSHTVSASDFERVDSWLRSLKKYLSYNGEWNPQDDEVAVLILKLLRSLTDEERR